MTTNPAKFPAGWEIGGVETPVEGWVVKTRSGVVEWFGSSSQSADQFAKNGGMKAVLLREVGPEREVFNGWALCHRLPLRCGHATIGLYRECPPTIPAGYGAIKVRIVEILG